MKDLELENINLKLELATIIMGYERELAQEKRKEISEFSKSCMKRYFQLTEEIKEKEND